MIKEQSHLTVLSYYDVLSPISSDSEDEAEFRLQGGKINQPRTWKSAAGGGQEGNMMMGTELN